MPAAHKFLGATTGAADCYDICTRKAAKALESTEPPDVLLFTGSRV